MKSTKSIPIYTIPFKLKEDGSFDLNYFLGNPPEIVLYRLLHYIPMTYFIRHSFNLGNGGIYDLPDHIINDRCRYIEAACCSLSSLQPFTISQSELFRSNTTVHLTKEDLGILGSTLSSMLSGRGSPYSESRDLLKRIIVSCNFDNKFISDSWNYACDLPRSTNSGFILPFFFMSKGEIIASVADVNNNSHLFELKDSFKDSPVSSTGWFFSLNNITPISRNTDDVLHAMNLMSFSCSGTEHSSTTFNTIRYLASIQLSIRYPRLAAKKSFATFPRMSLTQCRRLESALRNIVDIDKLTIGPITKRMLELLSMDSGNRGRDYPVDPVGCCEGFKAYLVGEEDVDGTVTEVEEPIEPPPEEEALPEESTMDEEDPDTQFDEDELGAEPSEEAPEDPDVSVVPPVEEPPPPELTEAEIKAQNKKLLFKLRVDNNVSITESLTTRLSIKILSSVLINNPDLPNEDREFIKEVLDVWVYRLTAESLKAIVSRYAKVVEIDTDVPVQ